MPWTFEQSTGKLYCPDGIQIYIGYAGGNCGKNPEGINNPAMQEVHNIGPIPQGMYNHGLCIDHSSLGAFAIPLLPFQSNEMFGRGSFFMHGDTETPRCASEGCIVMPPTVRRQYYLSADSVLQVVDVKDGN